MSRVGRRTYVYNPETREMEEVVYDTAPSVDAPAVHGDFKPVQIGGVTIADRGHLRRYLKANDLAPYDPSVPKRAREAKARAIKQDRVRALCDAYEHERNQKRAKERFG